MARPYKPRKTPDWRRSYADSFFTGPEDHRKYLEKFGAYCHICGLDTGSEPTDHLFPISFGGITVVGNLAVACGPCNSARGDKSPVRYYIERTAEGLPTRFSKVADYIRWLDEFMRPYRKHYPKEYAIASAMVNDKKELRVSSREAYLKELVNFRWRTTHDPLTLVQLGVPSDYERYWKQIHMQHPDLYFPDEKASSGSAFDRFRNSNDPKWLYVLKITENLSTKIKRDAYFNTAELVFADVTSMGYKNAYIHWRNKHNESNETLNRSAINVALKASKPIRPGFWGILTGSN